MQKRIAFLLFIPIFFLDHSFAQQTPDLLRQASIKGKVADTIDRKAMSNSVVLLLRRSDSILIRYARTDKAGNFLLKNIPTGQFLLLVSHPAYADYIDELKVSDSSAIDLPLIPLVLKSALLQAVVVSGNKGAIHIKGDTVEFRADSFHTQAGATVEELLKKLPGIQVDKNGKITAQGQTVQKVLVDGEEFFGDDPTLVTQNLRADMVDKVQVYDKKSDQAVFTGIDDGVRDKTINLKLKDNKKNGYFGKLSGGAGTNGYYDTQDMINIFAGKRKVAAYGIISNTGKTGLDWRDRDSYGQSVAGVIDYDVATDQYSFNGVQDDLDNWNGRYNGQGLPTVQTGGVHYNDKWDEDRQSVNGNYKIMQLAVTDSNSTNSENILPDSLYYNNQLQKSSNRILRQSADISYEIKFDSTSSLKILANGGTDHKTTNNFYVSEALAGDSSLVNQNTRTVSSLGDSRTINSNLLWRKQLPKKGRTLSVNFRENYTGSSSSGYLYSNTQFYSEGLATNDSVIDQFKRYHTENFLLDSKITWSEPLSASSFLVGNYGISFSNSSSDRNSYNRSANSKYDNLDSLYSNNYRYNTFTDRGGLAYSLVKKKIRFNIANNIGFTSFDQRDLGADTMTRRSFINWYPQAFFSWAFTPQRRLSLRYDGSTIQPTLQQIQPVLTNEDPLNITVGNPGLKPQFRNQFYLNFFDYKVLTERSIWGYLSYSFTGDAIGSQTTVDSTRKMVTQFINVNGDYTLNGDLEYYFKWRKPRLDIDMNLNVNQNDNVSVVDHLPNTTHSGSYKLGLNVQRSQDKKYELALHSFAMYTQSRSTINTGITTSYWSFDIDPSGQLFLPLKFGMGADCDVSLRQKISVFDNNTNVVFLNAWIGKKFLKNDVLQLRLSGNDLLNQNIGFNRTVNSNFISQNRYGTIQRYLMLSVTWNFTRAGTPAPAAR